MYRASRVYLFAGTVVWCAVSWPAVASANTETEGQIITVTLYRDQALVTRRLEIPATETGEVTVRSLPERVVPDSVYAEAEGPTDIRAVRVRALAASEAQREEVRALDEKIKQTQQQIAAAAGQQQVLNQQAQYLDKLESFSATTAMNDLARGALDAESLRQLADFSFQKREQIAQQLLDLEQKQQDLRTELELLQRQRAELTGGRPKANYEAVIFFENPQPQPAIIYLRYLVSDCGWSPSYTVRAKTDPETYHLSYSALAHQLTGEDWHQVQLTLSTSSPAVSAAGPGLAPFRVALRPRQPDEEALADLDTGQPFDAPAQGPSPPAQELVERVKSIREKQQVAVAQNQQTASFQANTSASWQLNDVVRELQTLELTTAADQVKTLSSDGFLSSPDTPSLNYTLPSPISLASRSDQQFVRIIEADMPGQFYHVAIPMLTSYVYREAELTNSSAHGLLTGPVTVYLDDRFVGRSEIPTIAQGQAFVVGFGAEPQLRTRRELADKREAVQGGNRQLEFTYRLALTNFKEQPAKLRIMDRLPQPQQERQIAVRLVEADRPLSEDHMYQRIERPRGILRWDLEVPGQATGEQALTLTYRYTIEFDRNFQLIAAQDAQQAQKEFEVLEQLRAMPAQPAP